MQDKQKQAMFRKLDRMATQLDAVAEMSNQVDDEYDDTKLVRTSLALTLVIAYVRNKIFLSNFII